MVEFSALLVQLGLAFPGFSVSGCLGLGVLAGVALHLLQVQVLEFFGFDVLPLEGAVIPLAILLVYLNVPIQHGGQLRIFLVFLYQLGEIEYLE